MPTAAADPSLEYAVKATFLYKFVPFVDWPPAALAQPNEPFVLCVVGSDPFAESIERTIVSQRVGDHPVVLRRLPTAGSQAGCHVMFVTGAPEEVAQTLQAAHGSPILTVTDSTPGAPAGIVRFVVVNGRVNFDIDNAAATANHLTISSKLLALAHSVTQGDRR